MKPINDGGPAFPTTRANIHYGEGKQAAFQGMTLRDYFAAAALTGIATDDAAQAPPREWDWSEVAKIAYRAADAMIAARGGAS